MDQNVQKTSDLYRDIFEADFLQATQIMHSKLQVRSDFSRTAKPSSDVVCGCEASTAAP